MGRGQLWYTILSREPRTVVSSISMMNVNSVVTDPEGDKDRLAVHRGPKISIIFPSPLLCAPSSSLAAKEKSPSEVTLLLSWTHMTLPLRILHPLCLTEVMKTKLLAFCLFSVISSVCCQQPEPWPFPIQGITVSSECTQGWWERCTSQQPSWVYVKKFRSKSCQDLWCLCSRYWAKDMFFLLLWGRDQLQGAMQFGTQGISKSVTSQLCSCTTLNTERKPQQKLDFSLEQLP